MEWFGTATERKIIHLDCLLGQQRQWNMEWTLIAGPTESPTPPNHILVDIFLDSPILGTSPLSKSFGQLEKGQNFFLRLLGP